MTRFRSVSLAFASALLFAEALTAARPRYGGALKLAAEGTIRTLDPAAVPAAADASTQRRILPLLFETLLDVDPDGGLRPLLATSFEQDAGRWRIRLRQGVRLHDGSTLNSAQVAAILGARFPGWQIAAQGELLTIEPASGPSDVPWALASPASAIAVRQPSGAWQGSGPFRLEQLEPARLTLTAHDGHWAGRPFVDSVQIQMGRPLAAQRADLELGRVDMVSVQPMDIRRLTQRQVRVVASRPVELIAVVFEPHRAASTNDAVRATLAAAFDRPAITRVLLQGHAEPAGALLPRWLSGYTRRSDPGRILSRAATAALSVERRTLLFRVSGADPVAQAITERLVVDAQQAGFMATMQVATGGVAARADLRVVRVAIDATSPDRALAGLMAALGARTLALTTTEVPLPGSPIGEVYRIEQALMTRHVIVPIAHLAEISAAGARVESWSGPLVLPSGGWNLANVWLKPELPVTK